MGFNCLFSDEGVTVFRKADSSIAFKGYLEDKIYLVDFINKEGPNLSACLIAKTTLGWLWHRRLAHVGMRNLHKLLKGGHVVGLKDVAFEKDKVCSACQARKQVGANHPSKTMMMTTRPYLLPPMLRYVTGPKRSMCSISNALVVVITVLDGWLAPTCFPAWHALHILSFSKATSFSPMTWPPFRSL